VNKLVSAFLIGGIFGLGIALSGMINPAKVLNFFDFAGTWDPSLAFVMAGGVVVAFVGYRLVFATRQRPAFENSFSLPSPNDIDLKLVGGSALFGIGWGIVGFCPGGAIPALGLLYWETPVFLAAMIAGIVAARFIQSRMSIQEAALG
jgi:uncharacterized membrane protein YedE/YeeE